MTPQNFNWFLHTMLFYHTRNVIKNQVNRARKKEGQKLDNDEDDSDSGDGGGDE
jgi:hypothetical protein